VSPLAERYKRRIGLVQEALRDRDLEALWVEPSVGLFYVSGLEPVSLERMFGLVIPTSGEARMVVPLLLRDECEHVDVAEHLTWGDAEGPESALSSALKGISRLQVQGSLPAWARYLLQEVRPDMEVDLDPGVLSGLRERKDAEEVELIRRSGSLTDEVVAWVGTLDLENITERQLVGKIQARYLELGHKPSPYSLIASGANAAMPHYVGGDAPIRTDRPLLMDFGGAVEGYWSDITRIYFPRDLDPGVEEAYEIVCDAYDAAFGVVEPGVTCDEVDRAAREVIEKAGYGEAFLHRTGHGLGLEVHEEPYLRGDNEKHLEVGHVFSIEPGIYIPERFGVRYENIVYLGQDGLQSINQSPSRHYFEE
jgi:Xaa-Pro aminopeptidase